MASPPAKRHRSVVALSLLALLLIALFAGRLLRSEAGIEFSPESIRAWVASLGWWAPIIYLGLVIFRQFLLLPSMVVLPAGGLVFGALLGTVLGALGIVISALLKFTVARSVAREWVRRYFSGSMERFERRVAAAGPFVVGLVTAHPAGPMSAVHWGSGFSTIRIWPFALAVTVGGLVRAFAYAFFGSALLDVGTARFAVASVLLAAVALGPLAHPGLRARILGTLRESGS